MDDRGLTGRQVEVLRMAGYGNQEAALRLGVTEGRVVRIWQEIYRRLGCRRHNKIAALRVALRRGIVDLGEIEMGDRRVVENG